MLTLTRKKGEIIDIFVGGRTIEVKVHSFRGNQVILGFEADKDVIIHRREITKRIKAKTKDGK